MKKSKVTLKARKLFARNLKKYRLEAGVSQEKLAEMCELHRTYVGSVERGERNISIDNMERMALALSMNVKDFLED